MKKVKGHFNDVDKFTAKHQEMVKWFLEERNVWHFVRFFLNDVPTSEIKVLLEETVKSKTDYLLGYTDVILIYDTDYNEKQTVLIEVKSSFYDYGAVLRQMKTYKEYRNDITKVCLITDMDFVDKNGEEDYDEYENCEKFFQSQNILFETFESIDYADFTGRPNEVIEFGGYKIPHGIREAEIVDCYFKPERKLLTIEYLAGYYDTYLGEEKTDFLSSQNLITFINTIHDELVPFEPSYDNPLRCKIKFFYDFEGGAVIHEIYLKDKTIKFV